MPNLKNSLVSLRPDKTDEIPFIIFFPFLMTFIVARIVVNLFPNFFLMLRGIHIHHFAYGIIILTLVGAYELIARPTGRVLYITAAIFGVGMGLAYDEFG